MSNENFKIDDVQLIQVNINSSKSRYTLGIANLTKEN